MLRSLDIKNVAVIELLSVDFHRGMTVLTGETGAGKSIIIDSINMILGARANKELVRHGANKAYVSAVFDMPKSFSQKLEEFGIEPEEDEIIISRELSSEGKSIARVNGCMVPLNTLREISSGLVNIHGQQDNQAVLDSSRHVEFLDLYGGNSEILEEYKGKYKTVKQIEKEIDGLVTDEEEKLRRIDMLKFQLDEIEKAELKIGEKEGLLEERVIAQNSVRLTQGVAKAYGALYESELMSAYDGISVASDALEEIAQYEKNIQELSGRLMDVKYAVEDIAHELRGMDLEYDQGYLNRIEERLDTIQTLEKKYGGSVEGVLDFFEKSSKELENINNSDQLLNELEEKLQREREVLKELGEKLYSRRKQAADRLSCEIEKELFGLDMEKAKFGVIVEHCNEFMKNGMDIVEFMISANPGEPLKALTKVASGGELSRTMLALKTVLSGCDDAGTLIFDEIDTGVSGSAAQKIAAKLWGLGKFGQVICISHQAQLAAFADNHYYIEKNIQGESAKTTVRLLKDDERKLEVARIIDGKDITQAAITHAGEMIRLAEEKKL